MAAEPHYIDHAGRYVFAWHHAPKPAQRRGVPVVLCAPIGSEYIGVYRVWRILAERLADAGFDVLRFDYEGTGDSAGDPEESNRLEAWIGDITCVVAEARALAGSSEVALVGLRIGATLALEAAVAAGGVDRLVLWSPFRSGRAYVRELKAFSRLSRKDYVTDIDSGPDILASGYILPGAIARALEGLNVDALAIRPAPDVLLIDRDDRTPDPAIGLRLESLGARVERVRPAGTAEMLERPALSTVPDAAIETITTWLGAWAPRDEMRDRPAVAAACRQPSAHGPGYCEGEVRFGPENRIFGILTMPDHTSTEGAVESGPAAVIMLNTGFEYRVGPHRLYVPLARELAAMGHVVLRYDLSGIGDSPAPPGAKDNVTYPAHALDDVRAAIAFIKARAPGRRVILAGLCSGAWYAFHAAHERLDIDAFVSINAPLYLREAAERRKQLSFEYEEIQIYRRNLRDRARWTRALRGRSSYVYFVQLSSTYLWRKVTDRVGPYFTSRLMDGLAKDLDAIAARGTTALFVYSEQDAGLAYLRRYARPALRRWNAAKRIRLAIVNGAGHAFSPPEAQRALREILVDFVTRQSSGPTPQG